jgi:ABC-type nitrate/sulfonate/bicarbonate transport system ATPase subunit
VRRLRSRPPRTRPGSDPLNLWGNAREGSVTVTVETPIREAPASQEGVRLEGVSRAYAGRRGSVQALDGVWLMVAPGEVVAVVGPSGCGKSTLLELICGLQQPDHGTVASPPAALMPQRDLLLPWLSALDNAGLALRARGMDRDRARETTLPWLERFGLSEFAASRPRELSGGMRQRVSFLRSLLAGTPVLALDEPFAALDAITRAEMQTWLSRMLSAERRTVVLVSHDVEEAILLADRVIVMSSRPGRVVCEVEVNLARPRRRTDESVLARRGRVLDALGVSPG